jgi:hypothetical protein
MHSATVVPNLPGKHEPEGHRKWVACPADLGRVSEPMVYSPAICTCAGRRIPAPEICDAIRKATTTAGTLINLRN